MNEDRVSRGEQSPWHLCVASGPRRGELFAIGVGDTCVGRESGDGVHIALDDPAVSRRHALLSCYAGQETSWIQDLGSSNGTFVNGQRIDGVSVGAGDVVRMGDSVAVIVHGLLAPSEESEDLGIVGRAPLIAQLRTMLRKVAPSPLSVLVIGATGTGKELVARALHDASGRRGHFVALNCAALPSTLVESALFGHRKGAFTGAVAEAEGAFSQANGGTLFLDEIGDLASDAQPKLLRALENGEITPVGATMPLRVDVRIVAATHVALDGALEDGRFRHDLYARLAGVVVKVPLLAERREDILPLFWSFIAAHGERELSADFVESLLLHAWPFNVRELRKLAERLLVLHADAPRWERGMLHEEMQPLLDVPAVAPPAPPVSPTTETSEGVPSRAQLVAWLERCHGNVSKVAELAGRNRKQVYRWMAQHDVVRGTGRRS